MTPCNNIAWKPRKSYQAFLAALSLLVGTVVMAASGAPTTGNTLPWLVWQRFEAGEARFFHGALVQTVRPGRPAKAASPGRAAGFEIWWGSPWRYVHRALAIDLDRSETASDASRSASLIHGPPDMEPMRWNLFWHVWVGYKDVDFIFVLVSLHPGRRASATSTVSSAQPPPFPDVGSPLPVGSPIAAETPPGPPEGKVGKPPSGGGAAVSGGTAPPPETAVRRSEPAVAPATEVVVVPIWVAVLLFVAASLFTIVTIVKILRRRHPPAPRQEKVAKSGEPHVDAFSHLPGLLAAGKEAEYIENLERYFDILTGNPVLVEREAARLRLLLEQTASRLARRQYEPDSSGPGVVTLEKAHATFWQRLVGFLEMPRLAPFWQAIIDETWEPQMTGHMVRALHFLEQGRPGPLLDLLAGLRALSRAAPVVTKRVGLDSFLGSLLPNGQESAGEALSAQDLGDPGALGLPAPVEREWTRIRQQGWTGKALLNRLHDQGVLSAVLDCLKRGSGPLRMQMAHLLPPSLSGSPAIVLFHFSPPPGPSPISVRLKGFNIGLAIRVDEDRFDLVVRNRNTEDSFFIPLTEDIARELGRRSEPPLRGWDLALIDGQDLRVTFLPRQEMPLDPSGETQRILGMIRDGHPREAISAWQRTALSDAVLSDVWLELALFHGSSLTDREFAVVRQRMEMALQGHPGHWLVLSAMGAICRREGRDEVALDFFARSYAAFPYDVNNLVSYVYALLALSDEENIQRIRNLTGLACDLNPRSPAVATLLQTLENGGISSRAFFHVCPIDSRAQG
jgi:hypothetical protein